MGAIRYRDATTGQTVPVSSGGGGGPDEVRVQDEQPTDEAWELWVDMDDDDTAVVGTPTGGLLVFAGAAAPAGWLVCDGAAVSRTAYAALFAVIGTTYGIGNGSTTFNLPDLKGRTPVGPDASQAEFDARGKVGGAKTHTLTQAEMPLHAHVTKAHNHAVNSHDYDFGSNNSQGGSFSTLGSNASTLRAPGFHTEVHGDTWTTDTGGSAAHNNLQPYIAMAWIIKA